MQRLSQYVSLFLTVGEFKTILRHARNLKFEEEPDYALIKGQLKAMFEANGFKYDDNFDWVESGMAPSRRSSAFLHLVSKQQEIARRHSARQVTGEEYNEVKNARQLRPQLLRSPANEQNSNSLAVNHTSHFVEQPSGEAQEPNSGNQRGSKSPRILSPTASPNEGNKKASKPEKVPKCKCLVL